MTSNEPKPPNEPLTIRQLTGVAVFCSVPRCMEEAPCTIHCSAEEAEQMRRDAVGREPWEAE